MSKEVVRSVKIITTSEILKDVPPVQEGFPMRKWSVKLAIVGADGEDVAPNLFDKVTYRLHPTFVNPNRTIKKPPFKLEEQGWGEFDLTVVMHVADKGGEHTVIHDLNFLQARYESVHKFSFPTGKPLLSRLLAESGPVDDEVVAEAPLALEEPTPAKKEKRKHEGLESTKKKTKQDRMIDMERLAEGLEKLEEDDLLHVVQMVTDNRTPDMYIKNDIEEGEFHMDLYTVPDHLLRMLWDLVRKKVFT
ncbi:yeats family-domain-containing protein [Dipodascopsis tothii]|uniref:yeats family-domain-containing protein n=1 Tax=Dipodascopsis tothii TaxID=44089 RepID=UPI0034CE1379